MKTLFTFGLMLTLVAASLIANAQIITTIVGTGTAGYYGDNSSAITAKLNNPINVKFDPSGNMYIADQQNNVVRKVNSSGIITTVAGTGIAGYSGDNDQATNAEIDRPNDIAFDAHGNIYIAEIGHNVIRKINSLGIITTIAGGGASGLGDGGPATAAQLNDPLGLVFDNAGNLYFSDNGNARVRKINASGIITTVAGSTVTGGYGGDSGPATDAILSYGGYISFGPSGDLYIADYGNYRIRKLNVATGIITTVIGNGTDANTGDGGPATAATITEMWAILFDQYGDMYLTDGQGKCIRKVDASGMISTIAGTGTPGYGGDGGPATDAQLAFEAVCSAVDGAGNLYIADFSNNRIRRIAYNTTEVNNVKASQNNISIYPNPATNTITLTTPSTLPNAEVKISNVPGEEVFNKTYSSLSQTDIDVGRFVSGVYFIKVNGVYAGKFVKE